MTQKNLFLEWLNKRFFPSLTNFSFYRISWILICFFLAVIVFVEHFGLAWPIHRPLLHYLDEVTHYPEPGVTLIVLPLQKQKKEKEDTPALLAAEDVALALRVATPFHPQAIAVCDPFKENGSVPLTHLHEAMRAGWSEQTPFFLGREVPILGTMQKPPIEEPLPSQLPLVQDGAPGQPLAPSSKISATPSGEERVTQATNAANSTNTASTPSATDTSNAASKSEAQENKLAWQRLEILRFSWLHLQPWDLRIIPGYTIANTDITPLWGKEEQVGLPLLARLQDGQTVGSLWWRLLFQNNQSEGGADHQAQFLQRAPSPETTLESFRLPHRTTLPVPLLIGDRFLWLGARHFLRISPEGACIDFPNRRTEAGSWGLMTLLSGSWQHLSPAEQIGLDQLLLHREELDRGNITTELDHFFAGKLILIGRAEWYQAAMQLQDLERRLSFNNIPAWGYGLILLLLAWSNMRLRSCSWLDRALWQLGGLLLYGFLFFQCYLHGRCFLPIFLPFIIGSVAWIPQKKEQKKI